MNHDRELGKCLKEDSLLNISSMAIGWLIGWMVKRRTRAAQWAITDDLDVTLKSGHETFHLNFDFLRSGWLPPFC